MRTCTKCKIEKSIDCFGIDKTKKDGLRPDCKSCRSVRKKPIMTLEEKKQKAKEYAIKNRDSIMMYKEVNRDKLKQQREKNKEAKRLYDKEYKLKNKEKIKENSRKYINENRERMKQKSREYYNNNKEAVRQYQIEYKRKRKEASKNFKNDITIQAHPAGYRLGLDD